MRWVLRLGGLQRPPWISLAVFCSALIFCVLVLPLLLELLDILDQYDAYYYLGDSLLGHGRRKPQDSAEPAVGDKIIVMASLESESTSWVAEKLPDWQRAIYHVNPPTFPDPANANSSSYQLTTPVNKGHEAMAYLTYIVEHYNSGLPSVIAFLHAHRQGFFQAWHVDAPFHDNVLAMQSLQLDFVVQNGYVNLRCNLNPGCTKRYKTLKSHVNAEVWEEIFSGMTTRLTVGTSPEAPVAELTSSEMDREKVDHMDVAIASACCAQFAVSRDQVLRRPLEDYVKIRQWVMDTERDDANSGRVMEYLWHVVFGKDLVYCPDQDICYCSVYGRC